MIVLADTTEDAEAVRRLFAAACHRLAGGAPTAWRSPVVVVLETIPDHSGSSKLTSVAAPLALSDDELMTFNEASRVSGMSLSTVKRRASDGTLVRVGRRLTAVSVRRWTGAQS